MCILLFEARESPASDEYALILANNRDELYERPTKVCHFWQRRVDQDSSSVVVDVIGGRDASLLGNEGGTWIGMSKSGKIGVLLNIWQPLGEEDQNASTRGHLVSDYLTSEDGHSNATTYLEAIAKGPKKYNDFRLVAMQIRPTFHDNVIGSYNNFDGAPPIYFKSGIYAFGNNRPGTQWNKVVRGREKFTPIVARHRDVESKERLVDELLGLLDDDTRYLPDPQVAIQGRGRTSDMIRGVSAIHVKVPSEKYGTRTNTVILVDGRGRVDYIERTMEEPIDARQPKWILTRHEFTLNASE